MKAKKLSPTVSRLIAPERDRRADATTFKLNKNQIADLKGVVQRRLVPPGAFNLADAMTALAGVEQSTDVAKILGRVLTNEKEAAVDRAVAAVNLRYMPGRIAQGQLVKNLGSKDRHVRLAVVQSLGTFGDRDALLALRKLRPSKGTAVDRQLAFAKSLIAHRLGSSSDRLPFRLGAKRESGAADDMVSLKLRPKLKKTVRKDRELLRGSTYGVELGDRGFGLRAGRASWTVFLNREIEQLGGFGQLFDRPWITALLARWDFQIRLSSVQYIVLTDPAPKSTEIAVVRTDGELFYSGRLTRKAGLLRFDIRDIDRPGTAPTNVSGRVTARGVELETTVPFGLRKNVRTGEVAVGSA